MSNHKPFKTHRQQIGLLRSRGLGIPKGGPALRALEHHGYYAIINGYKWSFLQRTSTGNVVRPEHFLRDAKFSEIKALYDFDRELRSILFEALLRYESTLSATLAYRFSEKNPAEHSYLAIDNYRPTSDAKTMENIVTTISNLSNTIKNQSKKDTAIKHYVKNHGHVPLWVLVNYLSFGDYNYFYRILPDDLRTSIAKDFTKSQRRSYGKGTFIHGIRPDAIDTINHFVNIFRNSVAHDEVTFSKKIKKPSKIGEIKQSLNIDYSFATKSGIFELILALHVVLEKKDFKRLSNRINELLDEYHSDFISIQFNSILNDMNFPQNYKDYLL